jgi:hypothetical protein
MLLRDRLLELIQAEGPFRGAVVEQLCERLESNDDLVIAETLCELHDDGELRVHRSTASGDFVKSIDLVVG